MAGDCNCSGACSCAMLSSGSTIVTGTGSRSNPFRVAMRASTAALDNRFVILSDGGYVAPQLIYLPGGGVLVPGEDGGLTLPPPCILDYNGDPIEADEDGCVQLPTSGAPPDFGCGLDTVPETGELKVATTESWPMLDLWGQPLDGVDTEAGGTICDSEGQVRTLPQGTAHTESMGEDLTLAGPTPIPNGGTWTSAASSGVALNNPSPTRSMLVGVRCVGVVDAVAKPLSGTVVRLQSRTNGGAWGTRRELLFPECFDADGFDIRSKLELTGFVTQVVGASDSVVVELRVTASNTTAGDPGVVLGVTFGLTALGVSR